MLKKYFKSDFIKNVSTLVSGTVIAQAIPIVLTPILSRIYSPKDFGFYGFYLSILGVLTVIASGRYHLALFITKNTAKTIYVFKTTVVVSLFFSAFISIVSILFSLYYPSFSNWYYILGLAVLNAALIEALNIYANIKSDYKIMSSNMIIRSLIANFFFIILGLWSYGENGLMIGFLMGQIVQILHFYYYYKADFTSHKINSRIIKKTLFTYKNFLIHSSVSALLNNLSIQLPTFFLKNYYNTASVGQYFQSYKLLTLPNSLIAKAFGSVFAQNASQRIKNKLPINDIVLSLYKKLVLISFIPFAILALYGDVIFSWILGQQWVESGKFAQIISPWVYINFIVLPFTYLFEIFQKQKHFSIFNLVLLVSRLIALIIGYYFKDIYLSILLFSIASFFTYGGMLFYIFKLTKVRGFINYILYIILFVSMTVLLYTFKL